MIKFETTAQQHNAKNFILRLAHRITLEPINRTQSKCKNDDPYNSKPHTIGFRTALVPYPSVDHRKNSTTAIKKALFTTRFPIRNWKRGLDPTYYNISDSDSGRVCAFSKTRLSAARNQDWNRERVEINCKESEGKSEREGTFLMLLFPLLSETRALVWQGSEPTSPCLVKLAA